MSFVPRLTKPDSSNVYYNSDNPWRYSPLVVGNCTTYAWCRFHEILGTKIDESGHRLSTYDAGTWYDGVQGYDKGKSPKLGSILVLDKGPYSGLGHVAVVEEIHEDGSIVTSEGGYNAYTFQLMDRQPPNYGHSAYVFKGFIYNPEGSDPAPSISEYVDPFVAEAAKHIGSSGHTWVKDNTSVGDGKWDAATVIAVAKACGFANKIMPGDNDFWAERYVPGRLAKYIVENFGGEYTAGPGRNGKYLPQKGDLVFFDWHQRRPTPENEWIADNVGIVESVNIKGGHNEFKSIEGDSSSTYRRVTRNIDAKTNFFYVTPNWNKLVETTYQYKPLYDYKNSRADAILREVGYMTADGEPSIKSTPYKLSVINYTTFLGTLVDAFYEANPSLLDSSYGASGTIDVSGVPNTTAQGVLRFLVSKGLNKAAACGVAGNIKAESNFDLRAVGDNGTSFGLCQWHGSRGDAMKKFASPNWQSNLDGQLTFLWNELTSGYSTLVTKLMAVPDNQTGCRNAADMFVRTYERPAYVDNASKLRQQYAVELYDRCK